jgi:DNA-binding NarL/FixJ family response regulator
MESSGSTITISGAARPPVCADAIVAVDHRPLLRSGLARIVWRAFGTRAVVVADLYRAAAAMRLSEARPRALLLGLRPGDDPAGMVRDAHEIASRVICVLDRSDPVLTRAALAAGANGYMLIEDTNPETLTDTLLAIEAGATVLPPTLEAHRRSGDGDGPPITDRCHEVLQSVAAGLHDDEIAAQLGISIRSVRKHIASAQARLQARTRIHALAIAAREGLV